MAESPQGDVTKGGDYRLPEGAERVEEYRTADGTTIRCRVQAKWLLLRKDERPSAEIFHVGAVGPRVVAFESNGVAPAPAAS